MSVTIKGVDKLFKKLNAAAAITVLEKPMHRSVLRLERDMKEYPPAPAKSRYIRGYGFKGGPRTSEKLGQRWTTRVTRSGNGLVGKAGNNASYAPLVQSAQFQARIHKRTGWRTDKSAVEKNRDAIVADFAREIDRALAS